MGYRSSLLAVVHASEVHQFNDVLKETNLHDEFTCENLDPNTGGLEEGKEYFVYSASYLKWYDTYPDVQIVNAFFEQSKASAMQRVGEEYNDVEVYGDKEFICFNNRIETELDLDSPTEEEEEDE